MNVQTVMIGGGPISSLVVLRPSKASKEESSSEKLPIRIGVVEAAAISAAVDGSPIRRPMTHELLLSCIKQMGGSLDSVEIVDVQKTTFYARLNVTTESGRHISIDARPSDAIALAIKESLPIFADEHVLARASMPDFDSVERDERQQEMQEFHEFVENLTPDDFK